MYEIISDFQTLLVSYQKARLCKRFNDTILRFGFFLEGNLLRLQRELKSGEYAPSSYVCFTILDPKVRRVAAPAFRDRVVQHALVSQIEPLFEKRFIYDSYACRKGKGTHFGMQRVKKFLAGVRSFFGGKKEIYCLRMDIEKFFASVSWDILLTLIFQQVTCPKTRELIRKIMTQHRCFDTHNRPIAPPADIVCPKERRGLPIGNLTSQLFANIYLNELDHFAKETLRIRWYARYMDDFLIIHQDKKYLHKTKHDIEAFLKQTLKLRLKKEKVVVSNVSSGVPFVGYRIFYDHVLIRGSTLLRMQRKLRKRRKDRKNGYISRRVFKTGLASIDGHLRYADSFNLSQKLLHRKR